jgi:hypothetical protein
MITESPAQTRVLYAKKLLWRLYFISGLLKSELLSLKIVACRNELFLLLVRLDEKDIPSVVLEGVLCVCVCVCVCLCVCVKASFLGCAYFRVDYFLSYGGGVCRRYGWSLGNAAVQVTVQRCLPATWSAARLVLFGSRHMG